MKQEINESEKFLTEEEIIEVFQDYQGYINTSGNKNGDDSFSEHEKRAKKAISILLYGVVER